MSDSKHHKRPRKRSKKRNPSRESRTLRTTTASGTYWLYGFHAVVAALANPARRSRKLLATSDALDALSRQVGAAAVGEAEIVNREAIARNLPHNAVHQGIALEVWPLALGRFDDALALGEDRLKPNIVVLLDQVTDPHNVGAVLRSAAAFGARAVVVTERHAPGETGTLAKAASGALDLVPYLRVTNLARALVLLGDIGYWRIGLHAGAEAKLTARVPHHDVAIVLGAEGRGIRPLTLQRTDQIMRIGMPAGSSMAMPSLNVSNAAAIALYTLTQTSV